MKKLFKRAIADLLAIAIAISSLIFGVSAAELSITGTGLSNNRLTVTIGSPVELTVNTQTANISARTNNTSVAVAAVNGKKVVVMGIMPGTAYIGISAGLDSVTIEVEVKDTTSSSDTGGLYSDPECTKAQNSNVVVYVNGGKTKGENVIDYKNATLYFKPNEAVKKYVATATTSANAPELTAKGDLPKDDTGIKEAADMVKVKADLKKNTVTITSGKKTSDDKSVTAWVFGLSQDGKIVTSASVKVTVKGAASSINVYNEPIRDDSTPVKSIVIAPNSKNNMIYFKGIIKDASKDKPNTLTDNDYVVEADSKATEVTLGTVNKYSGYFTVSAGSVTPDAKGKVKPISAKFKITNVQSGKSVTIPIIVDNCVNSVSSSIQDWYAKRIDEKGDVSKIDVVANRQDNNVPSTNKITGIVLNGAAAFNEKGKLITPKSKLCSVKIQDAANGYRARVIWSGAKEEVAKQAEEMQIIYLVATNSAKETKYFQIGKISREGMIYAGIS